MRHTMKWQTMMQDVRRTAEAAVASAEIPGAIVLVARGDDMEAIVVGSMLLGEGAPLQRNSSRFGVRCLARPP
jgi:hypothetical protein